jgi:hypothetical protein
MHASGSEPVASGAPSSHVPLAALPHTFRHFDATGVPPQSVQSVFGAQSSESDPGRPSSHEASFAREQSSVHAPQRGPLKQVISVPAASQQPPEQSASVMHEDAQERGPTPSLTQKTVLPPPQQSPSASQLAPTRRQPPPPHSSSVGAHTPAPSSSSAQQPLVQSAFS